MSANGAPLKCCDEIAAILDCVQHPAILLGTDYRILAANRAYRAEFAEGSPVRGQHCYEVSHHYCTNCEDVGETCPLKRCNGSGEPVRVLHVHYTPDGEEHQDVTAYPVLNGDGKLRAYLEVIRRSQAASTVASRDRLVGKSPAFNRMLEMVQRAAPSDTALLLLGESGTGKELVAQAIHNLSGRSDRPFVPVDCSGLTESLFESELFGHERGAFTGAFSRKRGLVEAARGGTLFLDEVGDIPLSLQVKLLRLLETGTFRRVGNVEPIRADFRLVCATHCDLEALMDRGAFRRDLYFRISAFPIRLPALRERLEDLPLLAESLLLRLNNGKRYRIHQDALAALYAYSFPGNIRELLNILERACLLADSDTITPEHLPDDCFADGKTSPVMPKGGEILPVSEVEARYLQWAVARFEGDNATLAEKLGMGERTFYRKLKNIRRASRGRGQPS